MTSRPLLVAATGVVSCLLAAGVLLLNAGRAWGPPAEGVPNMAVVGHRCVEYGQSIRVSGFGFAPGSSVKLSAPEGHYTGPPLPFTTIADVTVQATATGGFTGALTAPPAPRGNSWSWQPRVVFATGTSEVGEGEGQSFDQVLVATHQVCRTLEERHRKAATKMRSASP